jgi:hypothetical protein
MNGAAQISQRLLWESDTTAQPSASDERLPQVLPNSPAWSRFRAGWFGIAQTCDMHGSLPCRIGGKWFAISDRFATQFTTFCRGSQRGSCELRSWNRPIVGRTQEGAPFEAGVLGRCIGSHCQTSVAEIAGLRRFCLQGNIQSSKTRRKHSPGEAALNLLCLTNKWHVCQLGALSSWKKWT